MTSTINGEHFVLVNSLSETAKTKTLKGLACSLEGKRYKRAGFVAGVKKPSCRVDSRTRIRSRYPFCSREHRYFIKANN